MTAVFVKDKLAQVSEIINNSYENLNCCAGIDNPKDKVKWLESLPWVYPAEEEWKLAEKLVRHDPGPPIGSPEIIQIEVVPLLDEKSKLLLRRAFYDAKRITIKRLAGGKTAKEAFCVFANLASYLHGPQPMPFFVKLGTPWKIKSEMQQYQEVAEPFIPFYLRPALDNARSVITLNDAALACNFVENAISLRDALRSGQGHGAIFSLFETTLRGLRSHTSNTQKKSGVIDSFLALKARAHEIEAKHPSRIKFLESYGKTRRPQEIENSLRKQAANIESLEGPYHGDLHFGNIMVRNRDAIVIDFGSMGPFGPLYADPAVLEVSLIFGTDNEDDPKSFELWRDFVNFIFIDPIIPPLPNGDYPKFTWLHKSIRELRHVAACCGVSKSEALIILAGCLLRYGRNSPLKLDTKELDSLAENRRAYALVKAYEICESLEKQNATCQ